MTVPIRFEDYLASVGAERVDIQVCTACWRPGGRWQLNDDGNVYCERCLQYHHGHDQAEEKMVRAIVGAAVAAALDAGASDELVRRAVEDAIAGAEQIGDFTLSMEASS